MVRLAHFASLGFALSLGLGHAQAKPGQAAVCVLRAPDGGPAKGEVWLCDGDGGVHVTIVLRDLDPEALYTASLHTQGDASLPDGSRFGNVLRTTPEKTGTLGRVRVLSDGRGNEASSVAGLKLRDVLGRGITLRAQRGRTPLLLGVVGHALDTTPPTLSLVGQPQLREGFSTVTCKASDDRALALVRCAGQRATRSAQGGVDVFRLKLPSKAGVNAVEILASDGAGNVTSLPVSWTQDSTAPVIKVLAPRPGSQLNGSPVNVVATVEDENLATVTIGGQPAKQDAKGRWRLAVQPKEGRNVVSISAVDTLGNRATADATFEFDGTPPEIKAEAVIVVEGKVDDLRARLTVNGQVVQFNRRTGRYTAKVKADPQDPGRVTIVATDESGNQTTEVRRLR